MTSRVLHLGRQPPYNKPVETDDSNSAPSKKAEGMAGLAKGLAIIEAFSSSTREMTVSDAARAVSISPAAARRCLLTLSDLGYLHQAGRGFRPTPRMTRLGDAYLSGSSLAALSQTYAEVGRDMLGEAVSVAIYDDGDALFIARAAVQRIVSLGVRLGARLPAYASATGRVLLSGMPSEQVNHYLDHCHPQATTPFTVTSIDGIRGRIHQAHEDGYSLTDEELERGMRTLAVPVRNSAGRVVAAMSSSALTGRFSAEEMLDEHLPILQEQAAGLGRVL